MKKTLLFILPLAAILLVALTSCNKSDKEDGDDFIVDNDSITVDDPFMQACQHVSNINKEVKKYFKISNSIEELNKYADDIRQLRYVEAVYSTNTTMFVQIKDFGPIFYSFYPKLDKLATKQNIQKIKQIAKRAASDTEDHPLLGLENAVIINQVSKDEKMHLANDVASETKEILDKCDMSV